MLTALDGKWLVSIVSGPWWFKALRNNIKTIIGDKGKNTLDGCFDWGDFLISELSGMAIFIFHYIDEPIVDKVYFVDDDHFRGEFYWRGKYIGDFTMERIRGG